MTAPTGDDALREAVVEALIGQPVVRDYYTLPLTPRDAHMLADALLPVVLRYGRDKAAEELRAAADGLAYAPAAKAQWLRDRADELTAQDPT